ncbi:MerR family transcriptional regulator [Pediococcus inopinatus]|jgi:DNA-binding transcriptional MerR regulator|uniref:MerR family transcriptional regulator n=1 Tax=Pediococcus inopinatus TaxID=114090 RepID=A0ABZ0Q5P4_9LACO|nr:MerR family transcriptional regulator [Pediococcus inopinatus]AVK99560.1 MerR family transcriptional regulator [Pediococcus inopinatus]KRN63770.1 transcription regulator [Pediococcus inopinatus]WPC17282.1 MerR family transcriptional regulator [Pediococcus inopinatus]WPC18647.1 MerR family transcriptional regulator [Pediococcus inopinatus]WPC22261.1 MerR family transcriptional regulator [Pediococcus inopinatus]
MTYTIKEVAQKTGLSIYTLRFYDKQGLLPFVMRNEAGYRTFTESDLSIIHTICCLKNTDMKISDIRKYIEYVMAGSVTIDKRAKLLSAQRQKVLDKQKQLAESLQEIDYKLGIYESPEGPEMINQARAYVKNEKQLSEK